MFGRSLTFLRHLSPLRVGKLVLAHPDPAFHPWGDGLAGVGVKRREAAQPANAIPILSAHNVQDSNIFALWYSQNVHDDTQGPHVT